MPSWTVLRQDAERFASAVLHRWNESVNGGPVAIIFTIIAVGCALAGGVTGNAKIGFYGVMPLGLWVILTCPFAMVRAYSDQFRAAAEAENKLRETLNERRPNFIIRVKRCTLSWFEKQPGETLIFLWLSVSNDGLESAATEWRVSVPLEQQTVVGEFVRTASQGVIEGQRLEPTTDGKQRLVDGKNFSPSDSIRTRTHKPVPRGPVVSGFLLVRFPIELDEKMLQNLSVKCQDYQLNDYHVTLDEVTVTKGAIVVYI